MCQKRSSNLYMAHNILNLTFTDFRNAGHTDRWSVQQLLARVKPT